MRTAAKSSERACNLRLCIVQLAHFLRVQLWLHADWRLGEALREKQDVDGSRAYLQR
jgi:hypothetical protein